MAPKKDAKGGAGAKGAKVGGDADKGIFKSKTIRTNQFEDV